jgi:hypothetical protein
LERHVILDRPVSAALGACGLSREGLIRVLLLLHQDLPADHARHRSNRDATRSDCFRYRRQLLDGATWHLFDFLVEDSTSPDHLFVNSFGHQSRPAQG